MESSIEMKMQAIDKMLEQRKQLIIMANNTGLHMGFDPDTSITVYDASDFFEYAEKFGSEVKESDFKPSTGRICVYFSYHDCDFDCYLDATEVKEYAQRISFKV